MPDELVSRVVNRTDDLCGGGAECDGGERRERGAPGQSQRRRAAQHGEERPARDEAEPRNLDDAGPMNRQRQEASNRITAVYQPGDQHERPHAAGHERHRALNGERSAPGTLSTNALAAESSAVASVDHRKRHERRLAIAVNTRRADR